MTLPVNKATGSRIYGLACAGLTMFTFAEGPEHMAPALVYISIYGHGMRLLLHFVSFVVYIFLFISSLLLMLPMHKRFYLGMMSECYYL